MPQRDFGLSLVFLEQIGGGMPHNGILRFDVDRSVAIVQSNVISCVRAAGQSVSDSVYVRIRSGARNGVNEQVVAVNIIL